MSQKMLQYSYVKIHQEENLLNWQMSVADPEMTLTQWPVEASIRQAPN
jgi:hypothetical protein